MSKACRGGEEGRWLTGWAILEGRSGDEVQGEMWLAQASARERRRNLHQIPAGGRAPDQPDRNDSRSQHEKVLYRKRMEALLSSGGPQTDVLVGFLGFFMLLEMGISGT